MDLTKRYIAGDGDLINILDAVRADVEWAANRIQVGERALAMLSPDQRSAAERGESAPKTHNTARDAIALLREVFYARLPLGNRVDDVICEADAILHSRVHMFLEAQQHPC